MNARQAAQNVKRVEHEKKAALEEERLKREAELNKHITSSLEYVVKCYNNQIESASKNGYSKVTIKVMRTDGSTSHRRELEAHEEYKKLIAGIEADGFKVSLRLWSEDREGPGSDSIPTTLWYDYYLDIKW